MFSRNSNYENKKKQFKQAFTLIELGLVIIIIALLITAIITGQKIIERARLTSFITEIKEIASAFSSFNIAFGALPGDFDEANDYFPNTISGDGNNDIDSSTESDQVFYHLSEAKMLPDNYENGDLYNFTIKNSFGYVSYADGI